ncbi:MAG: phosphate ABC transporter permease PstA [Alphaproteobacteria bacterium]|nr:phosphate ABC transporter permease PstA [Alphaproteobacteria bacterium]MBO6629334.1 phosphate ABC transporter permease PstA [Alphaproteobacteria bacterium]MDF1627397.1 phosphate ABC transporter permease PstA [Parvibaculaceae bacterium]
MTDMTSQTSQTSPAKPAKPEISAGLKKRYAAERRFRAYGLGAILLAITVLFVLLASIVRQGTPAFFQTYLLVDVYMDPAIIDPKGERDSNVLARANYQALIKRALYERFPDVTERRAKRALTGLVSSGAYITVRESVISNPDIIGSTQSMWLVASDDVDTFNKGQISRDTAEEDRRVKDNEIAWLDALNVEERVELRFNSAFFTTGDSREPEQAGIWGAVVGSFLTLIVTLAVAFPLGVMAAAYLEEFAPKNRWTDLIEVNINNLAAVPSIVFGLLGLAVFLNFFGLPRSAPLVGGLVLALMTLPTIIIATRAALKAVPPSIREAALGIGASELQVVTHHVLPLAMPGILTGTIIGMAQALGETAPLLMIGMVAFIVDVPTLVTDPATVLPVQIYIWADSPERAFVAKTSAAIMVLLGFLITMNAIAVLLRKRFERRW